MFSNLNVTIISFGKRMVDTLFFSIAPAVIWTALFDKDENTGKLLPLSLRIAAGCATPVFVCITAITAALGLIAAIVQVIAFPFQCLVSKILDIYIERMIDKEKEKASKPDTGRHTSYKDLDIILPADRDPQAYVERPSTGISHFVEPTNGSGAPEAAARSLTPS